MCYAVGMVALVANAITPVTSIDFENSNLWGKVPRYGLDESGIEGGQGNSYWRYGGAEMNLSFITNYNYGETRYDRFNQLRNPRPSYMHGRSDNNGYVSVRALSPLVRAFNPVSDGGASAALTIPAANDLFIDKLVRFHPSTNSLYSVPLQDIDGKAKFMVWLSSPPGSGVTNLVVTGGRYTSSRSLYRCNYPVTNQVEVGRWYRLTVRAIANAATQRGVEAPGFVAYLDGVPLSAAAVDYVLGDEPAAIADTFAGNPHYERRSLFPPICAYETVKPSLSGFGVQGIAAYDEFAVVNDGNPFAREANELSVRVVLDPAKVTNVVCAVTAAGATAPYFTTNSVAEAEVVFTVRPGDKVKVTALAGHGFAPAPALALVGNPAAVASQSGYEFALTGGLAFADDAELVARVNVGDSYFRVGDGTYEFFEDALEAANASKSPLVMEKDVTLDPTTENGQLWIRSTHEITLDLHGRRITGEHFQDEAAIYDQGRLTIVDSVGGGAIVAPGNAVEVVADNDALEVKHQTAALTLGSTAIANDFSVRGRVRVSKGTLAICGGTYLTPPSLEPRDTFYLAQHVDQSRFTIVPGESETVGSKMCRNWQVTYDGRVLVKFEADSGTVSPASTNLNLDVGRKLVEPKVEALGWTITNWCEVATGRFWNFASDEVTGDMTLRALQKLDSYVIDYDYAVPVTALRSYTVERELTALPQVTRYNYTFGGWRDRNTGRMVAAVGKGACFVGTEIPVSGNLDLEALWLAELISWSNSGVAESNGTYSGTWQFTIPPRAGLALGDKVAIDEIAFGLVNPLLYPKSAAYLAVTTAAGQTVVSAPRSDFYDATSGEYLVGAQVLANGRSRLGYAFSDLQVEIGKTNVVFFSTAAGAQASGSLRLAYRPGKNDPLFSNCLKSGAPEEFERYTEYCPIYEVTGHAVEEVQ